MVASNDIQTQITQAEEAEKARLCAGEQVLVGATKYQDSSTLNAVAKEKTLLPLFFDFTALNIQYLQE